MWDRIVARLLKPDVVMPVLGLALFTTLGLTLLAGIWLYDMLHADVEALAESAWAWWAVDDGRRAACAIGGMFTCTWLVVREIRATAAVRASRPATDFPPPKRAPRWDSQQEVVRGGGRVQEGRFD